MYNHAPDNYLCPFCLVVQGVEHKAIYSVQSDLVYLDEAITAFVSSHQWPNNPGNVIIVPNEHYENIFDLPSRYALAIHQTARKIALAMKVVFSCDGITTRQHNEPAGNQDVWHYHLHVTPRFKGDQFYTTRAELMVVDERAKLAQILKEKL